MKKYSIILSILFTATVLLWVSSNINFGKDNWKGMLESDAKGYYAYLPAVFIYNDLNFTFLEKLEEKYKQKHLYYDYRNAVDGVLVNKYYCGSAVAQAPFFLVAHGVTYLLDDEADGYSKWYMYAVNIAAIFYHLLGIYLLSLLLKKYKVKQSIIVFVLLTISFGSNLFAYTIVEPGMSHIFSFAFLSGFLYATFSYFKKPSLKYILIASIAFGMLLICRPVNGLVLFLLPFLAGSVKRLKLLLNKRVLISLPVVGGIVFLQLLYYKLATGDFIVYSYNDEKFNFLNPHFFDILFSYKKGLFLYTPLYFLAFLSAFSLLSKSKFQFFSWVGFFLLITYVFSSWWMWFYGGSFSSRVYVEYLGFFAIPIVLFLNDLGLNWKRRLSYVALILIIVLCQIQTYQYRYYDIHYSEMTKEKYWEVFLMRNKF